MRLNEEEPGGAKIGDVSILSALEVRAQDVLAAQFGLTSPEEAHLLLLNIGSIIAVLPDFLLAGIFLIIWLIQPSLVLQYAQVAFFVMMIEFLTPHATVFMVSFAGSRGNRAARISALVVLGLFYSVFMLVISFITRNIWPFIGFWLLAGRYILHVALNRQTDGQKMTKTWAASLASLLIWMGSMMLAQIIAHVIPNVLPNYGVNVIPYHQFTRADYSNMQLIIFIPFGVIYFLIHGFYFLFNNYQVKQKAADATAAYSGAGQTGGYDGESPAALLPAKARTLDPAYESTKCVQQLKAAIQYNNNVSIGIVVIIVILLAIAIGVGRKDLIPWFVVVCSILLIGFIMVRYHIKQIKHSIWIVLNVQPETRQMSLYSQWESNGDSGSKCWYADIYDEHEKLINTIKINTVPESEKNASAIIRNSQQTRNIIHNSLEATRRTDVGAVQVYQTATPKDPIILHAEAGVLEGKVWQIGARV